MALNFFVPQAFRDNTDPRHFVADLGGLGFRIMYILRAITWLH